MQEFSSVTASSYDAESLAPLLNAQAADGWSVVSIVAAGTNIVAYLQREIDDQAAEAEPSVAAVEPVAEPAVADEAPVAEVDEVAALAEDVTAETTPVDAGMAVAAAAAAPIVDSVPAAVEEPAGWAAQAEVPADVPAEAPVEAAPVEAVQAESVIEQPTPEPEPVVEAAPAVESAVPAGWYADPSGRFELRYWDGTAWTEHVSRAGQQFTDPPVA